MPRYFTSLKKMPRSSWYILFAFILSRLFIWYFRPLAFSEIIYSYMPYAHLWAGGTMPYLQQWFEYPPATIPLFYLPHLVDTLTHGSFLHLDYGKAYRGMILLFDVLAFIYMTKLWKRTQKSSSMVKISVVYFVLITAKAHHFIFDTIDWVFAITFLISGTMPILNNKNLAVAYQWLAFWIGFALKLVNAPLGAIYLYMQRQKLAKNFAISLATMIAVWGVPLVVFRSSLQVMLVYHQQRGLQIDSLGAVVGRLINHLTHSEQVVELYKNYELVGPVSQIILKYLNLIFPLSLIGFVLFALWIIKKLPVKTYGFLGLHLTLGYIFVFMIFSKVLSTPFLLWHIPLLAVYPFANSKEQIKWLIPSFVVILISMSPLPFLSFYGISVPNTVHATKALLILYLFYRWTLLSFEYVKRGKISP